MHGRMTIELPRLRTTHQSVDKITFHRTECLLITGANYLINPSAVILGSSSLPEARSSRLKARDFVTKGSRMRPGTSPSLSWAWVPPEAMWRWILLSSSPIGSLGRTRRTSPSLCEMESCCVCVCVCVCVTLGSIKFDEYCATCVFLTLLYRTLWLDRKQEIRYSYTNY